MRWQKRGGLVDNFLSVKLGYYRIRKSMPESRFMHLYVLHDSRSVIHSLISSMISSLLCLVLFFAILKFVVHVPLNFNRISIEFQDCKKQHKTQQRGESARKSVSHFLIMNRAKHTSAWTNASFGHWLPYSVIAQFYWQNVVTHSCTPSPYLTQLFSPFHMSRA